MAQVTIYMDDDTVARMKAAAQDAGLSASAWLSQLVRDKTRSQWPPEVLALAGSWAEFATLEEIRSGEVPDAPREDF